ncbi:hypothetical protein [Paenarthrobacter histidinolovorans]|uniref:hypothetical protein n=1 Tax=Paenarthrobacter histidinolovorans TaxID=43664 RepID=UPI00166F5A74|nr:hypothetical protein [Paenarthrobacter histidinolovorans]GGJ22975.1 hypothetical protein GCM10010052_20060 [Paenarthrobacter histidinolovorans]
MNDFKIGDVIPLDVLSFTAAECTALAGHLGIDASCVLDKGHTGRHLAADAEMVVWAIWD